MQHNTFKYHFPPKIWSPESGARVDIQTTPAARYSEQDRGRIRLLTSRSAFGLSMLAALFLRRRKPAFEFHQATQIFDLAGVPRVAVDHAGETDA